MIQINDDDKILYRRLQEAKILFKHCNNPNEKIALSNYIANIYNAISQVSEKDLCVKKRDIFGSNKYYKKFSRKLINLEDEMLEHFMNNKAFHIGYMSDVTCGVEKIFPSDEDYKTEIYTELSMDDFNDIFYQFMKSIYLDDFFDKFLKNNNIYCYNMDSDSNTLGSALYNPINKDIDILIGDFIPDMHALFTLSHEMGHAYDISLFDKDVADYNRYFYQSFNGEVFSKLFERLFLNFVIKNNILKDEAHDQLLDLEDNNHDYLLACYILSLLDNNYIEDANYLDLDSEDYQDIIGKYFNENISEYLDKITCFDLQEDFTYCYGDIISMFLKDSIDKYGFNNDLIKEFLNTRDEMFDEEFFMQNGLSSSSYLDLYEKELKLLKK